MNNWLYINPYVHISIKKHQAILYNTLNGVLLEYCNDSPKLISIIKRLNSKKNLYVIKLSSKDIYSNTIKDFILQIEQSYIGGLLDSQASKRKPIQIIPTLNIQYDIDHIKKHIKKFNNHDAKDLIYKRIKTYLREVTIYINSNETPIADKRKDAYKQFIYPIYSKEYTELPFNVINNLFIVLDKFNLEAINIAGNEIYKHSKFFDLIRLFNQSKSYINYHFNYKEYYDCIDELLDISLRKSIFVICVDFPVDKQVLSNSIKYNYRNSRMTQYNFIIETEDDLKNADKLINYYKLKTSKLIPYYNNKNIDFFKRYVFHSKNDFYKERITMNDIYRHKVINNRDFGKLTVLCNQNVHANLNTSRIGSLLEDTLFNIIFNELYSGKNWRRLRHKVSPCNKCIYNLLCPSLSNYEYAIRKNNICKIRSQ